MTEASEGTQASLAERARADRLAHEAADAEWERTQPASNMQRMLAHEVGEIFGVEIDPRSVVDEGWKHPYYRASVVVLGITFRGRYMSDSNGLHRISAPLVARRRKWGRTQTRSVASLGDLDGWLSGA